MPGHTHTSGKRLSRFLNPRSKPCARIVNWQRCRMFFSSSGIARVSTSSPLFGRVVPMKQNRSGRRLAGVHGRSP